uniref:Uncharacterized protein n=1 Tax=Panagrolaimus superbus TaxID=310955 RepID=A0A914Z7N7_9BILA
MEEWIQKHEGKEKQKFLQLLKKYQSNPGLEDIDELNVKQESDDGPNVSRKRKHCETESIVDNADKDIVLSDVTQPNMNDGQNFDTDVSVEIPSKKQQLMFSTEQCRKVIDKSCFKIVNYKQKNGIYRKLLVFAKSEPSYCYEYNWNGRKKYFNHRCNKHPNGHKAILALDEEGNEYVKLEDKPQKCAPILYDPKRYNEVKITKKSNYEILENCKTKSKRILIIFDSNDKTQCYEYYLTSQNKFECCGCAVKKKHLVAEIYYENTENEYIRLQNAQHV